MEVTMKRKTAILLSLLLMLSTTQMNFVFANEDNDNINNEDKITVEQTENMENTSGTAIEVENTMELSIEEAIKLAKESSREMWKIDDGLKEIKDMRKDARDAKDMAEAIMGMPLDKLAESGISVTDNYVETLLAKNGYYLEFANTKTQEIEKNRELLNLKIEIETKSQYYQVLLAEKAIEINQSNLNKAKEQLKVINLKFNNGSATKAEILNGEMAVQKAQTDLDSSLDDLELAKLDLLNKIDLPFDTKIELTDKELEYIPTVDINLEESIEKAKEDRPEILNAKNNLELQKIETHVYTAYYTSNLRQNKAALEKLKDAELNIPQVYKDVELDVRKSYLNLVKAERSLVNMDKTVELAKESARINKLLYENGMASSLDVLTADTQLAQAEIGRYQLLISYNLNKMMFDNSNLMGGMAGK
jgi:outer membrane efflux protein